MGFIYKPAGRTRYRMKYKDVAGVWQNDATGETDERDAQKKLHATETDIGRGVPVNRGVGKLRFKEAAASIERDYRLRRLKSGDVLKIKLAHLRDAFGDDRKMATITKADVDAYIDAKLTDGYEPATVNTHLGTLKRMFTIAIQNGTLLYAPTLSKLTPAPPRAGFFERADFDRVIAALPSKALQRAVTVAYLTGWRTQSEILTLQWSRNVDWAAGLLTLEVGSTKNGDGRTFPYGVLPELAQLMADLKRDADAWQRAHDTVCVWLFHDDAGRPFLKHSAGKLKIKTPVYDDWRAACLAAGCPGKLLHDFRRTAVRNLVRAGVSEKAAMALTGHRTRKVFDAYHIVNAADLRDSVAKLAAAPKAATGTPRGRVVAMRRRVAK